MSLIQEALKRQEEEQKKANESKSISEAISDDVKLKLTPEDTKSQPDIIDVSTPEDSPVVDSISDDNDELDDFILPDDFSMDSFDDSTQDTSSLLIKDDVEKAPSSLLAKKEEFAFDPSDETEKKPLSPPQEGLGSLKLQNKEAPKKLYEDPVEKESSKKSKKKKKKVSEAPPPPSGTAVHPALNNTGGEEESSDKKSTFKVVLVIILFLILIGAGVYYGLSLIGVDVDTSNITKYIPGQESINKKLTGSSPEDWKKGSIKVSKVVDNPKSTAGKAIKKADAAAQGLQQAQKQEDTVTETLTSSGSERVEKEDVNNTTAVNQKTTPSETVSDTKSAEKSLADKYDNLSMTERIKAKLEAKRLEEERLKQVQQSEETTEKNIVWPSVSLSGTIGLSKSGAAIFDKSNIVNVGETYKGMKLIDVIKNKKRGVTLEYEGETRFLATGQSL
jgi:hypothetical protein